MRRLGKNLANVIVDDFFKKSKIASSGFSRKSLGYFFKIRFFKIRLMRWLFVPLVFLVLSACGNDGKTDEDAQNAVQDESNDQKPNAGQKFASIKDFKFLDLTDASSLGIADKGVQLPIARSLSKNKVASLEHGNFPADSLNVAESVTPDSKTVSQEKRIYKVDILGNKFFLNYQAEDLDAVLNLPYEPVDLQPLDDTWTAIRFKPTNLQDWEESDYREWDYIRREKDEVVFVNKTDGSVYLLEKVTEDVPQLLSNLEKATQRVSQILWNFKQGAEHSFYAVNDLMPKRSMFRLDFSKETPTLENILPKSHKVFSYGKHFYTIYTKNDAVIYPNTSDGKLYIKFVKENALRSISSKASAADSGRFNTDPKYGCGLVDLLRLAEFTATSPDGHLLCARVHSANLSYRDSEGRKLKFAHTLSVVKLTLDASARDGIASTETVVDFNLNQLNPDDYLGVLDEHNRFIQLERMLFRTVYNATRSKHLTLLKVYPKGDTNVYEFKDISGDWTKMDPRSWQKDGGSYRQFDNELYIFTKRADGSGYGMWKLDLNDLSAGAEEIFGNPKFETFTSFKRTWFTDDKKFLVEGVDSNGRSFTGRIDLKPIKPAMQHISEFQNEVIRLIKLN